MEITLDCTHRASLTYPSTIAAGSNHAGQLGVGGTADVQEPQVLQVRHSHK